MLHSTGVLTALPFRDREHRGEHRKMKAAAGSGQSPQPRTPVQ